MELTSVSVFASGKLDHSIDVDVLEEYSCFETNLRPRLATIRFGNGTVRVTSSGSISAVSQGQEGNAFTLMDMTADVLSSIFGPTRVESAGITNISAKTALGRNVDLDRLLLTLPVGTADYDPEYHPSLVARHEGLTISVFSNGSVSATGARTVSDLMNGLRSFASLIV